MTELPRTKKGSRCWRRACRFLISLDKATTFTLVLQSLWNPSMSSLEINLKS